ncbi:MAG TPA: GntR family transcriptional regulator [Kineosporiaceae bacterium]|nr:GntR family transcriptional regulator [Kineosporiaceae bacterium]
MNPRPRPDRAPGSRPSASGPGLQASAADRVAAQLRSGIFAGDPAPGTPLREVDLAARYGVSRHTVREALRELVVAGLVSQDPFRSARVRVLTRADVRDLFGLRRVVELEAVRRIVEDDAPLTALEAAVAAREAVEPDGPDDALRYTVPELDADLDFHRAVVLAAGSPRLARTFDMLAGELRLAFLALVHDADDRGHHRAILTAIRERDATLAPDLLDTHIRDGLRICLAAAPD